MGNKCTGTSSHGSQQHKQPPHNPQPKPPNYSQNKPQQKPQQKPGYKPQKGGKHHEHGAFGDNNMY